jgi:hypothetical protein
MQAPETGEWTVEQWRKAWSIHVGKAYTCNQCHTMIMVTKGGIGTLEPLCCGQKMQPVKSSS